MSRHAQPRFSAASAEGPTSFICATACAWRSWTGIGTRCPAAYTNGKIRVLAPRRGRRISCHNNDLEPSGNNFFASSFLSFPHQYFPLLSHLCWCARTPVGTPSRPKAASRDPPAHPISGQESVSCCATGYIYATWRTQRYRNEQTQHSQRPVPHGIASGASGPPCSGSCPYP